ncbi:MAG: TIGR00730 family Rossman fold protein [Elusimicrobia bacterium]|nr:TIGR00730 family Rossman fold protein [Elusimicrobiota bacterium]
MKYMVNIQKRIKLLKRSPSYIKAYEDLEFLKSVKLRPARLQLELLKPDLVLQANHIHSTIVVFGSARISSPERTRSAVRILEKKLKASPRSRGIQQHLAIARRVQLKSKYYEEARRFARIVSMQSGHQGSQRYLMVTGGGPGIMEAANRGAYEVKARSIGFNITLPHEQNPNPYISPEFCFLFHYFAIRKMHLLMRAKALVFFPGGYGTMDELFEVLTLVQTGKKEQFPIILFGREFWERVINFDSLVEEGVISPGDTNIFKFVEKAEEAWKIISDFYKKN